MSEPDTAAVRTRSFTWDDPMTCAAAARAMSGRDFLEAMVRGDYPRPPIAHALGFALVEVGEGAAVFEVTPAEYHYNPIGVVHGGLLATLLDSAMGCAVNAALPVGMGFTTLEIKVNYLRPLTMATGPVRAEGTVVHLGRRVAVAEASLSDASGKVYATASATCLILAV